MQSIENELSKGIERLSLVSSTRKSALITHWIDAFKYGFPTAVILLPVLKSGHYAKCLVFFPITQ